MEFKIDVISLGFEDQRNSKMKLLDEYKIHIQWVYIEVWSSKDGKRNDIYNVGSLLGQTLLVSISKNNVTRIIWCQGWIRYWI